MIAALRVEISGDCRYSILTGYPGFSTMRSSHRLGDDAFPCLKAVQFGNEIEEAVAGLGGKPVKNETLTRARRMCSENTAGSFHCEEMPWPIFWKKL